MCDVVSPRIIEMPSIRSRASLTNSCIWRLWDNILLFALFAGMQRMKSTALAQKSHKLAGDSVPKASDDFDDFEDQLEAATEEIQVTRQTEERQRFEAGIIPVGSPTRPVGPRPTIRLDAHNRRAWLLDPCPRTCGSVECRIYRDPGFGLNTKYVMFLEDGNQFCLSARKEKKKTTSHYAMYSEQDMKDASFAGKVKSNFVGTEFSIVDAGIKPGKKRVTGPLRQHLGCIIYETNILGTKGPRRVQVAIPHVTEDGSRAAFNAATDADDFVELYKLGSRQHMISLQNKEPQWNDELKAYVLNFNGRVSKPSVKNFQLIADDRDAIVMQFGKVGKNNFTLDFQYPLSGLQAFAIALSAFDHKLACE
eukprot:TRINITY_DN14150_c0_g1_i1.p1 TRINITY_DN14150_c0_g1~~TRINITY_DN14150_c0_g1_i1.p1  ORF type:complete len:365 (+),score=34.48 TRINITY_DN14150_c0_g1_i1:559-1653(+)